MAAKFPIDTAQIVALFLESVLYGVYLVTFIACIKVLLWYNGRLKSWPALNKGMFIAALAMFIFASMDVGFGLNNNIEAFVRFVGDPEDHFNDIGEWTNVMKMANYVAQTFVGDAILLYRCFVVYDRNWWIIILPALLWVGTTVCGIMTSYIEVSIGTGALSQSQLKPFITSMLVLTLACNVLTTGLIVFRIWRVDAQVSQFRSSGSSSNSPLARVMRVLVESGLIYTTAILILFGTYLADSNAILAVSNAVVQIIGITFNLIIISTDRARKSSGTSQIPSQGNPGISISGGASLPLHMLNIHTEVSVQRHRDPIDNESSISTGDLKGEREREEKRTIDETHAW
ncbi:hypothetical protein ONZ45_g11651 [Pleurotus djamor]|nr:hypothetical protein ONZ45_g11651 [Pleurotus djamor]